MRRPGCPARADRTPHFAGEAGAAVRGGRGGCSRPSGAVRVWAALARRLRSRSRSAPFSLPPSPSRRPAAWGGGPAGLGWRRGYVTWGAPVSGRLGGGRGLSARGWGKLRDASAPGVLLATPLPAAAAAGAQEETALVGWGVCGRWGTCLSVFLASSGF